MTDLLQVEQRLNEAFDGVKEARTRLYQATELYEKSKLIREQKQAIEIFNGVEGKNAEQRSANLQVILNAEFDEENATADDLRVTKYEYDIAVYELSRWKSMLRLFEVQVALESK